MFCTDRFLAISQPKTGSTTRRNGFSKILGGRVFLDYGEVEKHHPYRYKGHRFGGHVPLHAIPAEAIKDRLTVATVRNPWDWYVSVWKHIRPRREGVIHEHSNAWGTGDQSFEAVLYGMTHPEEVPNPVPRHEVSAPGGHDPKNPWPRGLWSHSTHWYYGGSRMWIDLAVQNEVWATVLAPEHADALRGCMVWNVSEGLTETERWPWTMEQFEWVWNADQELIQRLGYTEPGKPASKPYSEEVVLGGLSAPVSA